MPGDTTFLAGEQIDREEFDSQRTRNTLPTASFRPKAKPVLQGITKASLANAFLHLGRIVPGNHARPDRSGNAGKVDTLEGLKENVIVGRLIPAGTGAYMNRIKHLAAERDQIAIAAQQQAQALGMADVGNQNVAEPSEAAPPARRSKMAS